MRQLRWFLAAGLALATLQQQVLLQRPPQLRRLESSTVTSGPAALSAKFSRPMERASVAKTSQLEPALACLLYTSDAADE